MTSISQRLALEARMLSVVQAIQPDSVSGVPSSWPSVCLFRTGNSIRSERSCTPMVNKGRSRAADADGSMISETDDGILERIDRS